MAARARYGQLQPDNIHENVMAIITKEYSASASNTIDISLETDFPSANVVEIYWRATDLSGDDQVGARLDQGAGVATSGYHWANEIQSSNDATPAYISNTSAEIGETFIQLTRNVDGADADASASGLIVIPRPRTTTAAKMLMFQTAATTAAGTASGVESIRGGGSLHALNAAIDTLRLFLGGGSATATWTAFVVGYS